LELSVIHDSIMDILGLAVSFTEKYLQVRGDRLPSKTERQKHKRMSSLSDDEFLEPLTSTESLTEAAFTEFVKHVDDRFLRAVPFIRSGLKAYTKAAEFPTLGILAASLEAGIR
jgi:hypothetical protein